MNFSAKKTFQDWRILKRVIFCLGFFLNAFVAAAQTKTVSSIQRLVVKDIQWDSKLGSSKKLKIDIPKDAISFSIFVHSLDSKSYYLVDSLTDPSGETFVSSEANATQESPQPFPEWFGASQFYSPNRDMIDFNSPGYHGLLVPNSPKLKLKSGAWLLQVKGVDANSQPSKSEPQIVILIKVKTGGRLKAQTRGQIKINLQFTGSHGLSAKSAKQDVEFQKQLKKLADIYERVGIELKVAAYQDIKFVEKTAVSGQASGNELFRMGKLTDGINFIFIENIAFADDPSQRVDGLAGAVFGPQSIVGVSQNAVLISTKKQDPLIRQAPLANIMAHEMAHQLGLPHTIDGPDTRDPFDDTTEAGDFDYLMQAGLATDTSLITPQQRDLLLLSPAVSLLE